MKKLLILFFITPLIAVNAQWNSKGVPDNLDETDTEVSAALLKDIDRVLAERSSTPIPQKHPEMFNGEYSSNIALAETASIKVTFVHEGAGFRNSFGYFTYTADNVPQKASDVNLIPIFPNASYEGSGGGLKTGNTVTIGPFPAGTIVGFWVKSNAWDSTTQTIGNGYWTLFSLNHLNPESTAEKRQHIAMFFHEESQKLVMGFEDINRDSSWCDNDFNDLIFFATSNPITAVETEEYYTYTADYDSDNDGIPDTSDAYPDDPKRASVSYFPAQNQESYLAFEDNFPYKGDYDFNDLVIGYQSTEILDAEGKLKELKINMKIKALGAMYHNGFAIQLPVPPEKVQGIAFKINGVDASNPLEIGHINETVIRVIGSVQQHIDGSLFPNTLDGTPEIRADRFEVSIIFKEGVTGVAWPYNPFLIVNQDRGREIHLAGKQPTEFANSNFFNTGDDATVQGTSNTYKDSSGMPFAMLMPPNWKWPIEFVDINNVYPFMREWAESGGTLRTNWAEIKVDSLIWRPTNEDDPTSDNFNNDAKAAFWKDVDHGVKDGQIDEIDSVLKIKTATPDVWYDTNYFTARYLTLSGDFDVSVKVVSQQASHTWAKAGIIAKENMELADGHLCFAAITPWAGAIFQFDGNGDGNITSHHSKYTDTQGRTTWLRLKKSGNSMLSYYKQDGDTDWKMISMHVFSTVPDTLDVGLFAVSHTHDYATVIFDDWVISD